MDKYLQYKPIELSEDSSFIRWAKGSESKDGLDWEGWLANHPEKKEDVEKAKEIVNAMRFSLEKPSTAQQEKVWSKISTEINSEQSDTVRKPSRRPAIVRMLMYGAAAAVLLILLFQYTGNNYDTTVNVSFATVERVDLPDGSSVTINAGSELKYDVESWNENRVVSLDGEAFFDVEKGSKFEVKTKHGRVAVLGTSFNVYARKKKFSVHCETGKVSVLSAGKETILNPKQSVSVVNRKHQFEENVSETENRSSWKRGVFVYKATPLIEVIEELERQFDLTVTMDKELNTIRYTGGFKKDDRETAFTEVLYPLGLTFDINGKRVIISK